MNKKLTTEEIIQRCKKIHGDKYDYSLVDYIGIELKIKIICSKHGVFEQLVSNHTDKKQGCPKCVGRYRTTAEFINKSNLIHKNKYDYSLVDYKNSHSKIKINCPIHGEFEQISIDHLTNFY